MNIIDRLNHIKDFLVSKFKEDAHCVVYKKSEGFEFDPSDFSVPDIFVLEVPDDKLCGTNPYRCPAVKIDLDRFDGEVYNIVMTLVVVDPCIHKTEICTKVGENKFVYENKFYDKDGNEIEFTNFNSVELTKASILFTEQVLDYIFGYSVICSQISNIRAEYSSSKVNKPYCYSQISFDIRLTNNNRRNLVNLRNTY